MNILPPQVLRNLLHHGIKPTPSSLSVLRPIVTRCRPLSATQSHTWNHDGGVKAQWRQLSSSAFRGKDGKKGDGMEEKDTKNVSETFYMPPPPGMDTVREVPIKEEEVTEAVKEALPATPESEARGTETVTEQVRSEPSPTEAEPRVEPELPEPVAKEARVETSLPSQRQEQRWQLSKRLQSRMDQLLAKAAFVSHQVNNYTGTDFSGIERLRREIIDQEQVVKTAHASVASAKEAYTTSYSQQASSQKEVVGLLERKHSWSAADLERYMSLIRSEHLNEQAVQAAKEALADAERHLEDARSKLEKKERKQYHEEQIWSDTIRRNSTWVTFGLMGLNIFLLLANLVIIEPWRRRRMVKEIRSALDEKTTVKPAIAAAEAQVDQAVEPAGQPLEELEEQVVETVENVASEVVPEAVQETVVETQPETEEEEKAVGETALAAGEVLPEEALEVSEPISEVTTPAPEEPTPQTQPENWEERFKLWKEVTLAQLALFKARLQDLFSERQVTLKKVDVTAIALEGAAAGIVVVGFLWVMLNPR